MSYTKRPLERLNLLDDFLMGAVASNEDVGPEFCRMMVSTFLGREVGDVQVIAQRTILASSPELRGIRMDVEVRETGRKAKGFPAMNIYDIEPHIPRDRYLARRNRFYQAKIDGRLVLSGIQDFSRMPALYIITITPYDPFGYDYMMYTVQNQCREVPNLSYEDGLQFIYLNPKGHKGGNREIQDMLRYFENSQEENAINADLQKMHHYVNKVRMLPEVEKDYMKFEEIIWYEREEAAEEAAKENALENICDLLEDYGEIPDALKERMGREDDMGILKKWLKLAARVKSIEEFESRLEETGKPCNSAP